MNQEIKITITDTSENKIKLHVEFENEFDMNATIEETQGAEQALLVMMNAFAEWNTTEAP